MLIWDLLCSRLWTHVSVMATTRKYHLAKSLVPFGICKELYCHKFPFVSSSKLLSTFLLENSLFLQFIKWSVSQWAQTRAVSTFPLQTPSTIFFRLINISVFINILLTYLTPQDVQLSFCVYITLDSSGFQILCYYIWFLVVDNLLLVFGEKKVF